MPREFTRSERISAQMQRELAEILQREFKLPGTGMITVSKVIVTKDLTAATAYVSFLGANFDNEACTKNVQDSTPQIRQLLGKRLRIRVLPELNFKHDNTFEVVDRVERLLNSARTKSGTTADTNPPDPNS